MPWRKKRHSRTPSASAIKENNMQRLLILAALLLAGSYANAQGVSYNYAEFAYQRVSIDRGPDGNGLAVSGSFAFNESWYGFAGYSSADFNFGIDLDQVYIGAGYHLPLTKSTDFFGELAYVDASADANGFGSSGDNGIAAIIGARGMLTPRFELQGTLSYVDLGGGGSSTAIGAEGWYTFGGKFAAGITTEFGDDADAFGLGVRWYFDK
jgi:hypothetical protein